MAWNLTVSSSPSSMKMSNKNRGAQVLGMVSPRASPPIRDIEGPSCGGGSPKRQFYSAFDQHDEMVEEDMGRDSLPLSEKKRKPTVEQVTYLEASFEMDDKLDRERKARIAKEVGLPQRQVAIWFQNRRARSRNKKVQRDYDILKAAYDEVVKENEKLKAEVAGLRAQLQGWESSNKDDERQATDSYVEKLKKMAQPSNNNCTKVGVKIELEVSTGAQSAGGAPAKATTNSNDGSGSGGGARSESDASCMKLDDSTIFASEDLLASMHNNPLLLQHFALKLEGSGCVTEDYLFFWDEPGIFPWSD